MKKYRALKDVAYWGIKAGEVYEGGKTGDYVTNTVGGINVIPLLEAGIIEEVPERLTVENIKDGEKYWYPVKHWSESAIWRGTSQDKVNALFGIFRTRAWSDARRGQIIAYCKELDAKNE